MSAMSFIQKYTEFIENNADKRIDHYFLMGSPWKVFTLTLVYWLFVKKIGPRLMKNRQAFDLRQTMLVFNILQIISNTYLFVKVFPVFFTNPAYSDDWACMLSVRTGDKTIVHLAYMYYLIKVSDYMDTIFMVLRKNTRQVTFLHVYHHILMTLAAYYYTRFVGGGHAVLLGALNCAVHAVMYLYYFLCALQPELKKSLWWKKHITHFQLLQFTILIVHFIRPIIHKNCAAPMYLMWFSLIQSIVMMVLFTNFYIKTYILAAPKVKK